MTTTIEQTETPPPPAAPQPEVATLEQAQALVPQAIRAAWVASGDTIERLGRVLAPLAVGLVDELVKLTAVVPEQARLGELPSPPVDVLTYRKPGLLDLRKRCLDELIEPLRRAKTQLLHALDVQAWPICRRLAAQLNCPALVSVWALGDADRLTRLGPPAKGVIAPSEPLHRQLADRRVLTAEQVHLIRPGVFQVRRSTSPDDPLVSEAIVVSGSLDVAGPYETVLASLAQLHARRREFVCFVIGNGRAEKRLRHLVEKLNLRHQITFVDRQPARPLAGILRTADVYIMPAPDRHLPLEALAAQATGVPVVYNSAEAADFLVHCQTALRFDPANPTELTGMLSRLLDDRGWARGLADNALEHLRTHHGVGGAVARTAELYRCCLKR